MENQNVADISLLESIQNEINSAMMCASNSLFNARFTVFDKKLHQSDNDKRRMEYYKKMFEEEEKFLIKSSDEFKKKKVQYETLKREYEKTKNPNLKSQYYRAENAFVDIRMKRLNSRGNLKGGVKLLQSVGVKADSQELTKSDD